MTWTRRRLLAHAVWSAGGASLLGAVACSKDARWRESIADLEGRLPQMMAEFKVPGLSIAVIRDASVAWRRGFGLRSHASSAPVDDDTIFEGQSMSKPVFAYRVMKSCELGVLDLDAPLTRYTPGGRTRARATTTCNRSSPAWSGTSIPRGAAPSRWTIASARPTSATT